MHSLGGGKRCFLIVFIAALSFYPVDFGSYHCSNSLVKNKGKVLIEGLEIGRMSEVHRSNILSLSSAPLVSLNNHVGEHARLVASFRKYYLPKTSVGISIDPFAKPLLNKDDSSGILESAGSNMIRGM